MASTPVKLGQQYCNAGGDPTIWQVVSVFGNTTGISHARLTNVARPWEFKTLSCSVLADSSWYRLISDDPEHGVALNRLPPKRRRATLRPQSAYA